MERRDISALCSMDHGIDPTGLSWTALTCLPLCPYVSLCLSKLLCKGERPFPCRDSEPGSCLYSLSESGTGETDKNLGLGKCLVQLWDPVTTFLSRSHYANEADKGP